MCAIMAAKSIILNPKNFVLNRTFNRKPHLSDQRGISLALAEPKLTVVIRGDVECMIPVLIGAVPAKHTPRVMVAHVARGLGNGLVNKT